MTSACLGCNRIEIRSVTLQSGVTVCDYCPAYRHECEVMEVVRMQGKRREYIDGVAKQRGPAAAKRIEQDVRDELARRKQEGRG